MFTIFKAGSVPYVVNYINGVRVIDITKNKEYDITSRFENSALVSMNETGEFLYINSEELCLFNFITGSVRRLGQITPEEYVVYFSGKHIIINDMSCKQSFRYVNTSNGFDEIYEVGEYENFAVCNDYIYFSKLSKIYKLSIIYGEICDELDVTICECCHDIVQDLTFSMKGTLIANLFCEKCGKTGFIKDNKVFFSDLSDIIFAMVTPNNAANIIGNSFIIDNCTSMTIHSPYEFACHYLIVWGENLRLPSFSRNMKPLYSAVTLAVYDLNS